MAHIYGSPIAPRAETASEATTPPESPVDQESASECTTLASPTPIQESIPPTSHIAQLAFGLDTIPRFFHLLRHCKTIIRTHGPHTTFSGTTIFARATVPRSKPSKPPSTKLLGTSLAAAQDSIHTPQPASPSKDDLQIFKLLWDATIDVLEQVLNDGELDHEAFGWGVFGLSSGYMAAGPITSPSAFVSGEDPDPLFTTHKERLHDALLSLPSITSPQRARHTFIVSGAERLNELTKSRRQVHVCSSLLIQRMRNEGWARVRWWHGVAVAQRWVGHLGLEHASMVDEEAEEEEFGQGI